MKKDKGKKTLAIILLLILIAISLDAYIRYKKDANPGYSILNIKDDPMSLAGYTQVEISTAQNSMILTKSCKSLVMSTTDIQVYSIQQGLDNKIDTRPLTHDTMKGIIDNFDIKVLMVKISELDKGLYTASLFLKQDDNLLNLETRPSDSIALAVRKNAPIYLRKDILEREGQDSC